MTDIVERLNDSLVWASPRERALRTEAAAEIVRLRGEVGSFLPIGHRCEWQDNIGRWWPCTITGWSPAVYGADLDDGTQANGYARGRFRSSIAPAEAKDPAPAMPNGVEEMVAYLDNWLSREHGLNLGRVKVGDAVDAALRAADNRDAAGVDDSHAFKNFHRSLCARFGYTHDETDWRRDQVSLEEHIANLVTHAAVPAGEAVARTMINHDHEPHCIGCYDIHWNGGDPVAVCNECGCRVALLDQFVSPQPADGEAVAPYCYEIVWTDGVATYPLDLPPLLPADRSRVKPLYTTPPAPVQAAPQEGEAAYWERWHPTHGVVSVNREPLGESIVDNRWEDRPLYRANPSACALGTVRELVAKWRTEADGWYGDDFNRGRQAAAIRLADELEAALQHRGDSRGGEGSGG